MSIATETAEKMRLEAIGLLVAERESIEAALSRLGFDGSVAPTSAKGKRPCQICQSTEHDGRFHRTQKKPDELPAVPTN